MRVTAFLAESNKIERILRDPTAHEIQVTVDLLGQPALMVSMLETLARVYAGASLRDQLGMNVRVGAHFPDPGGPEIRKTLGAFVSQINEGKWTPHAAHHYYETLHPFMDGNGRTGRALWLWMMKQAGQLDGALRLGFLHAWYYQSLQDHR